MIQKWRLHGKIEQKNFWLSDRAGAFLIFQAKISPPMTCAQLSAFQQNCYAWWPKIVYKIKTVLLNLLYGRNKRLPPCRSADRKQRARTTAVPRAAELYRLSLPSRLRGAGRLVAISGADKPAVQSVCCATAVLVSQTLSPGTPARSCAAPCKQRGKFRHIQT